MDIETKLNLIPNREKYQTKFPKLLNYLTPINNFHKIMEFNRINNFVFISSIGVSNPNGWISRFINTIRPDALGLKNLVEIALIKSGINYLIIKQEEEQL